MARYRRHNNIWKEATRWRRHNGIWKEVQERYRRIDGIWQLVYSAAVAEPGQFHHTSPVVEQFQVPNGITSINCVCIGRGGIGNYLAGGGGALAYSNNIPVTPGEMLNVSAGHASDGSYLRRGSTNLVMAANGTDIAGGQASNSVGQVRHSGGDGGYGGISDGGGGAAGFSGNGGDGGEVNFLNPTAGSGGGGGGGSGNDDLFSPGGGGGGNGGMVQGNSGGAGDGSSPGGGGGSGGSDGGSNGAGGNYGGGSGSTSIAGGLGSVYIVWGEGREFPFDSAPV